MERITVSRSAGAGSASLALASSHAGGTESNAAPKGHDSKDVTHDTREEGGVTIEGISKGDDTLASLTAAAAQPSFPAMARMMQATPSVSTLRKAAQGFTSPPVSVLQLLTSP